LSRVLNLLTTDRHGAAEPQPKASAESQMNTDERRSAFICVHLWLHFVQFMLLLFLMVAAGAPLAHARKSGAGRDSRQSTQNSADIRIDYNLARREIQSLEAAINGVINSMFSNSPFALTQKAKGAYLKGYGFIFNFLVDIHRAVINTPFGTARVYPEMMLEEKKKRIEEVKEKLARVIFDSGDGLRQLPKDESVTIVAFLQDRSFPDEESISRTIVMRASKKDIDELAHKENRFKELKQRIEVIEY
jgi:hypothetical protein